MGRGICGGVVGAGQGGTRIGKSDAVFIVVSSSGGTENEVRSEGKSHEDGAETMDVEADSVEPNVRGGRGGILGSVSTFGMPPLGFPWTLDMSTCSWPSMLASRESSAGFWKRN